MPSFDVQGALQAGYSPKDILDHMASQPAQPGTFDVAGARQAGYSDDEVLQHLSGSPATSASQPASNAPVGSMLDALGNGLKYESRASLARGSELALRAAGQDQMAANAGQTARDLRGQAAANFQEPKDLPESFSKAIGAGDYSGAARRLGYNVAEGAGTAVAPLAAAGLTAAGIAGSPLALAGAGAAAGLTALQTLGGVGDSKAAAGLDGSRLNAGDFANAGLQTALNVAPWVSKGPGFLLREGLQAAESGARGGISEGLNVFSNALQGGDVGTAADIGARILDAGATGAVSKPAFDLVTRAPMGAAGAIGEARQARKAGDNMRAYSTETQGWNDAVKQATADAQKANPQASPEDIQSAAYQAASASGAQPPSFDRLSPGAQQGMAELAAVQMYQARRKAETEGMGRDAADMTPGRTFKGVMDDIATNLTANRDSMVSAGLLTRDQAKPLTDAISEARKHNRQAAEGGAEFGYFDTFRDQVASLPVDPVVRNQLLAQLRVLDIASQNSLEYRSRGPLEMLARNLPFAGSVVGGAVGAIMSGTPFGAAAGGLAGKLAQAQAITTAKSLDKIGGWALPDILRRQKAIEGFAAKNNLSSVADPLALQQMTADNRALGPNARPSGNPLQSPNGGPTVPPESQPRVPLGVDPTRSHYGPSPGALGTPQGASGPLPGTPLPGTPTGAPGASTGSVINRATFEATGHQDMGRFGQETRAGIQAALASGQTVTAHVDGKVVQIVSADNGALRDASGQPWGIHGIISNPSNRIEIGPARQGPHGVQQGPSTIPPATPLPLAAGRTPRTPLGTPEAPTRAPVGTPIPKDFAGAMQATREALSTRAQRLADASRASFPSVTKGWEAGIATTLGVPATKVREVVKGAIDSGAVHPDIVAHLQQGDHEIPLQLMRDLTGYVRDHLESQPATPSDAGAANPVRNPQSYQAAIHAEQAAAFEARGSHPDGVSAIQGNKHVDDRAAAMEGYLTTIKDPAARASAERILGPLTRFGDKRKRS